jgi:hypothetical protein
MRRVRVSDRFDQATSRSLHVHRLLVHRNWLQSSALPTELRRLFFGSQSSHLPTQLGDWRDFFGNKRLGVQLKPPPGTSLSTIRSLKVGRLRRSVEI